VNLNKLVTDALERYLKGEFLENAWYEKLPTPE
jgi:hypothetical protein